MSFFVDSRPTANKLRTHLLPRGSPPAVVASEEGVEEVALLGADGRVVLVLRCDGVRDKRRESNASDGGSCHIKESDNEPESVNLPGRRATCRPPACHRSLACP